MKKNLSLSISVSHWFWEKKRGREKKLVDLEHRMWAPLNHITVFVWNRSSKKRRTRMVKITFGAAMWKRLHVYRERKRERKNLLVHKNCDRWKWRLIKIVDSRQRQRTNSSRKGRAKKREIENQRIVRGREKENRHCWESTEHCWDSDCASMHEMDG